MEYELQSPQHISRQAPVFNVISHLSPRIPPLTDIKSNTTNLIIFTYWQGFGNTDVDRAIAGGLEDVHSIIQTGAFQVSFINKHESVTR